MNSRIYLVTDRARAGENLLGKVESALKGGIGFLQYREKDPNFIDYKKDAKILFDLAQEYDVPFIVNDDYDLALRLGSDGLHMGQKDIPLKKIRSEFNGIIGVSCHSLSQANEAYKDGADYVSFGGAWKSIVTNSEYPLIGIDKVHELSSKFDSIPTVTIGGIKESTLKQIIDSGIDYFAMVGSILASEDVEKTVRLYNTLINKYSDGKHWKRIRND